MANIIDFAVGNIKKAANGLFGDTNQQQAGNQNFFTDTAKNVGQAVHNFTTPAYNNPNTRFNLPEQFNAAMQNPIGQGIRDLPASFKILGQNAPGAFNDLVMHPQQSANYARQTPQYSQFKVPGLQSLANFSANSGQSFGQGLQNMAVGASDIYSRPGILNKVQAGAKLALGAGQTIAPFTGLYDVANAATSLPQSTDVNLNRGQRFAAGTLRGIGADSTLAPNVKNKNSIYFDALGQHVAFDPFETAGQMLGFSKNPVNKQLFKLTEAVFPAGNITTAGNLKNFLKVASFKGSIEGVLQNLAQMPENATTQQKLAFLAQNAAFGAASEVGTRGLSDIAGAGLNKLKNSDLGVKAYDELRHLVTPVTTTQLDANGNRIVKPMWQHWLDTEGQKGLIKPDAEIVNPFKKGKKNVAEAGLTSDRATIQELKNSIDEGKMLLRSGTSNGRNLSQDEMVNIAKSVENAQAKIGAEIKDGYSIQSLSPDQLMNKSASGVRPDELTKDGLRNWKTLVKRGEATFENGKYIKAQPNDVNQPVGDIGAKLGTNLKLTDAYPKDFMGYNMPELERVAKEKNYNLYDNLLKRVDSQDQMPKRLEGMQSIMDDLYGASKQPIPDIKPKVQLKVKNMAQQIDQEINGGIPNVPMGKVKLQPKALEQSQSQLSSPASEIPLPQVPSSLGGNGSSRKIIPHVPNSQEPYFNTNKLNVSNKAKANLNKVIQEVRPAIEGVTGKKLSNKEIIDQANTSAKVLHSVTDREQTAAWEASLLKARQKLADSAKNGTVDQDYIDNLISIKSHATDIARKLQSFSIGADPKVVTSKEAILDAVTRVEKDASKVLAASNGVDFNDINQATDFYRKFVKPSTGEYIDLLRYNSMLSSPNTHINNTFSNLGNSGVIAPIEKTITGTLDFLSPRRRIQGKPQTQFAGEGGAFAKGYVTNLHEASHRFADVMRGNRVSTNLDTRNIPLATKGVKGKVVNVLSTPMKMLEGMDQFFSALTEGGETAALKLRQSKGVNVGDIASKASENSAYRLFRSELHDKRQGYVLNAIDDVTGVIQKLRGSNNPVTSTVAKFVVPFLKTPMNILKQMTEYSPAGVITLPGAANKTEQLSKTIVGSSVVLGASLLATSGRTTWAEPTNAKQKAQFRAAGMQPYAVKIGNNWVSYAKLPPALSANLALVAAVNDAKEKGTLNDSDVDNIFSGVAKWGNFFADQSYAKQVGDMVAATKGDAEAITKYVSNYPQQLVPFRAAMGWIARITDPYQRKVDKDGSVLQQQIQQLETNIPGLSQNVPARLDNKGQPIENQNRVLNAFSPARITTEKPEAKQEYNNMLDKSLQNKNENLIKGKLKASGDSSAQSGENYFIKQANGDVKKINISGALTPPTLTGQAELDKKLTSKYNSSITARSNDIVSLFQAGKIDQSKAEQLLEQLKQSKLGTSGRGGRGGGLGRIRKGKKLKVARIRIKRPKAMKMSRFKVKVPKLAKVRLGNQA